MPVTPKEHSADADKATEAANEMVKLTFLVPPSWRDALVKAAQVQRISMADLCRIILRGFLRERYTVEQRAHLGVD